MPVLGRIEGVACAGAVFAGTTGATAAGGNATSSGRPSAKAVASARTSSGQDVLAPSALAWFGVTTWAAANVDSDRSSAVKAKRFMAFPGSVAAARFRTRNVARNSACTHECNRFPGTLQNA